MSVALIARVAEAHPAHAAAWETGIGLLSLVAVIVLGEILPKSMAAAMPERLAPLAGPPLVALGYVVAPSGSSWATRWSCR